MSLQNSKKSYPIIYKNFPNNRGCNFDKILSDRYKIISTEIQITLIVNFAFLAIVFNFLEIENLIIVFRLILKKHIRICRS